MAEAEAKIKLSVTGQNQVAAAFQQVEGGVLGAVRQIANLQRVIAGIGTLGAFTLGINRAIDQADALGKAAQKAGVFVEQFSGLVYSGKLADATMEQLQVGMKNLAMWMERSGNTTSTLNAEFFRLADIMAAMPDGADKVRLATDRLGRSGQDLIPLLNQGSAALREQIEEARRFGLVIGPEFAAGAEEFNDNTMRMRQMLDGLFLQVAQKLLPEMNRLIEGLLNFAKETNAISYAVEFIVAGFRNMAAQIMTVYYAIKGMAVFFGAFVGEMENGKGPLDALAQASKRVSENTREYIERLKELTGLSQKQGGSGLTPKAAEGDTLSALERERKLREETNKEIQRGFELERQRVQSDFRLTDTEKYSLVKKSYEDEVRLLGEQIEQLRTRRQLLEEQGDPFGEIQVIDQQMGDVSQSWRRAGQRRDTFDRTADPASFRDQFTDAFTRMQEQGALSARNIARAFTQVIGGAIDAISDGISGLIKGTLTWGNALRQIGTAIFDEIINSIVRMGVQFLITHVLMRGIMAATSLVGEMLGWKQVATTNAQEAAKAPALAVNATSASVGSYGSAAIIGAIAAIAAIGLVTAAAMGAFKEGGYTGSGNPNDVAGVVHRGEFVVPADAVNSIGLDQLNMLAAGVVPTAPSQGGASAAAGGSAFNLALVDSRSAAADYLSTREGRKKIMEIVGRNAHTLRARS